MAEAQGVRIVTGFTVTGLKSASGATSAITAVETDRGDIECGYLVILQEDRLM